MVVTGKMLSEVMVVSVKMMRWWSNNETRGQSRQRCGEEESSAVKPWPKVELWRHFVGSNPSGRKSVGLPHPASFLLNYTSKRKFYLKHDTYQFQFLTI
ncbi:unnamed protein product [Lactuca virosa]|uniref:Uncharacterized protein n=1 Tax=Lactuca virosa TaxID=75947 RepID=A0AAU9NBZ0_9ASTR|nr:unnamed protein product [Lactuca virosa]